MIAFDGRAEQAKAMTEKCSRSCCPYRGRFRQHGCLTEAVRQLFKAFGWTSYHTHNSKHSDAGLPDFIAWKHDDGVLYLIVTELKRDGKAATKIQMLWLQMFASLADVINEPGTGVSMQVKLWNCTDYHAGRIENAIQLGDSWARENEDRIDLSHLRD